MEKVIRDRDDLEKERKKLLTTIINLEQQLGEKSRDIELKDVKIESLESIMQRRDQQAEYT
jgi:hypothetical protein